MTAIDIDVPSIINMLDIGVARLKQARSIDIPTEKADEYIDEVIDDLGKWSDWFREQMTNAHESKV